jgi:hypothetical protein
MVILENHTVQLLTWKQEHRPIIFVAHGFGGLVCANALSERYGKEPTLKPVWDAIIGFLFLGTPFERSKEAFAEIAQRYRFEEKLENPAEQSAMLLTIKENFLASLKARDRISAPLEIACFYEGEKTAEGIVIVPKNSARLPAVDLYLIHANHDEICKFEDDSDPGYEIVSRLLRQWIRACDVISGSRFDVSVGHSYQTMVTGDIYSGNFDRDSFTSSSNSNTFGGRVLGGLGLTRPDSPWKRK